MVDTTSLLLPSNPRLFPLDSLRPLRVKIGTAVDNEEVITIGDIERRSGTYVLGISGMGKTTLLVNMIDQDVNHGHGVFFLDPHADAIADLARQGCLFKPDLENRVFVIDPETESASFGINLLHCHNIASLNSRSDTYKKAFNVFYKLWEDSWGPWLQLIIQNTLYVFIENQDYTLSEVPLFLTNVDFRNYLVGNMRFNADVADFWLYEFGARRERDQQDQVQAALTRVRTLLNQQYVRDIVGQKTTTVDFASVMEKNQIILLKLSANLATDIKKFIGTIIVSELLRAARSRPENKRHQFCIFVDEFQNFATEDVASLINEGRKFGIATTLAHQERFGQFGDDRRIHGATAACANKVFFRLTVNDAKELAPEFAEKAQETESRREAALVLSSKPVEDLWERGHPNSQVMQIRSRYFWIVDRLRMYPQQKFFTFPVERIGLDEKRESAGQLDADQFMDWIAYRSSIKQLKEGIGALNRYYYDCMLGIEVTDLPERIVKLIECWGGVLGIRRAMEPLIPLDKFDVGKKIARRIEHLLDDIYMSRSGPLEEMPDLAPVQFTPELIGIYNFGASAMSIGDDPPSVEDIAGWEYVAYPKDDFPLYTLEQQIVWWQKPITGEEREHLCLLIEQIIQKRRAPDQLLSAENVTRARERYSNYLIREEKNRWDKAHEMQPPYYSYAQIEWKEQWAAKLRREGKAATAGLTKEYIDKMRKEGLTRRMMEAFSGDLRVIHFGVNKNDEVHRRRTKPLTEAEEQSIKRNFDYEIYKDDKVYERRLMEAECTGREYMRIFAIRVDWQLRKLERFIEDCFFRCAELLAKEPLKVFSGKYEETLKMERTQADMVNEMAHELTNLARFTAYAKVIEEKGGVQSVLKRKMYTLQMRKMAERYPAPEGEFREALEAAQKRGFQDAERRLLEKTAASGMCVARAAIEKEIRARQEPWRGRGRVDTPPPSKSGDLSNDEPPPGREESLL